MSPASFKDWLLSDNTLVGNDVIKSKAGVFFALHQKFTVRSDPRTVKHYARLHFDESTNVGDRMSVIELGD